MADWLAEKKFSVEHALNMYASSYVTMPAMGIYEEEIIRHFALPLQTCHIYLVGFVPKVDFVGAAQEGSELVTTFEILGDKHDLRWHIPQTAKLIEKDEVWVVYDEATGVGGFPDENLCLLRLNNEKDVRNFNVQYIGQAYGEDGSRNAVDRLKAHSTLQQIAIKGTPAGHILTLIMLEILPETRMLTLFNPKAKERGQTENRIKNGIDKMFSTTEPERITLYEASLIRYFQPKFNKEFKNSFPSTNMKLLSDCYEKDILP